ncbi:hypothetical protein Vretifemale_5463, partial [Volvox reticuliferus]
MRFCSSMTSCPLLGAWRGCDAVFLDTTYCHPKHTFPLQEESVDYVVRTLAGLLEEDRAAEAEGTVPLAAVDAATGALREVKKGDPAAAVGSTAAALAALSDDPPGGTWATPEVANKPQDTEKSAVHDAVPASGFPGDETIAPEGSDNVCSGTVSGVGFGAILATNAPLSDAAAATGTVPAAGARFVRTKRSGESTDSGSAELNAPPEGKELGLAEAAGE